MCLEGHCLRIYPEEHPPTGLRPCLNRASPLPDCISFSEEIKKLKKEKKRIKK
jgi:hypothetical protein